jgi:hypothetical protein
MMFKIINDSGIIPIGLNIFSVTLFFSIKCTYPDWNGDLANVGIISVTTVFQYT